MQEVILKNQFEAKNFILDVTYMATLSDDMGIKIDLLIITTADGTDITKLLFALAATEDIEATMVDFAFDHFENQQLLRIN